MVKREVISCDKAYDLIENYMDDGIELDALQKIINILYPCEYKVVEGDE